MKQFVYKLIGAVGILFVVMCIILMIQEIFPHNGSEISKVTEDASEKIVEFNKDLNDRNEKELDKNEFEIEETADSEEALGELEKTEICQHDWRYEELIAPTCLAEGKGKYYCTICDESYEETLSALGHEESGWILDQKATKQHGGRHHKICNRCKAYLADEVIQKLTGEDDWIMTNYADVSGDQGMFYTFYNRLDGTLIVIDGGKDLNTSQVRSVINAYGGYVDAWFITHYHDDHVSPFNRIFADPQGIKIEKVYVSLMDYSYYAQVAESWDRLDCLTQFLNVTAGAPNVEGVKKGQWIDIDGLSFHIINAYSDDIKKYGDVPNNASIAMVVRAKDDSILFCADCWLDELVMSWKTEYGEELCVRYLQPGHHGNGWISNDFYDFVNPQVVLFDAPSWEMENDGYRAKALKEHMESRGALCYDYSTGNHAFAFE